MEAYRTLLEAYRTLLEAYDELYYRFRMLAVEHEVSTEHFGELTRWSQRARRRAQKLWVAEHQARGKHNAQARSQCTMHVHKHQARARPMASSLLAHSTVAR